MTVLPSNPTPFSIDDVVLFNRLKRVGKSPPNFASRKEQEEWLAANRHLVEDEPKAS